MIIIRVYCVNRLVDAVHLATLKTFEPILPSPSRPCNAKQPFKGIGKSYFSQQSAFAQSIVSRPPFLDNPQRMPQHHF